MKSLKVALAVSYVAGYPTFAFFAPTVAGEAGPLVLPLVVGPIVFVIGHLQMYRSTRSFRIWLSLGAALTQVWTAAAIIMFPPLAIGPITMVVAAILAWRWQPTDGSPMPTLQPASENY